MNILVTGANRGLGLAFTSHYLNQGHSVWACYRSSPGGLNSLDSTRLTLLQWDVSQATRPENLSQLPDKIDLLINNAGVYGPAKAMGQSLDAIKPEDMISVFDINCVGALRIVQSVKNKIISAGGIIANISSKMGSSADNSSGGCYAYRAAKAAMVIVSKSMAMDLKPVGVQVITLHPGWVRTDMTSHTGEIDAETSVSGMCGVIERIGEYEPGAFVGWDAEVIPY